MPGNIVETIDHNVIIRRVLISVFDKTGLDAFARRLVSLVPDVVILSTGGTFAALEKALGDAAASRLVQVSDYTGQPETQGGLVKTLDFKIYLGLLTETYNTSHQADLARTNGSAIDMVVVNLYPFAAVTAREGVSVEEARANIDIGGPCMIRAAAKNYIRVASVTDPADYDAVLNDLEAGGGSLSLERRFRLARKAFATTSGYDAAIARFLEASEIETVRSCYQFADADS